MYCPKCGTETPESDRFCRYCGGALDTSDSSTPASEIINQNSSGGDPEAAKRSFNHARRAHLKKRWEEAIAGYKETLVLGPDLKTEQRTERHIKLAEANKRPSGTLGFWAIGIVAVPVILTSLATLLPPRVEHVMIIPLMSLMSLGALVAIICAFMGLFFQHGTANRIGAALVLGGFAFYFAQIIGMSGVKNARIIIQEGVAHAGAARMGVAEFYHANGHMPSSNAEANVVEPTEIDSNYVHSVTITEGGVITIMYRAQEFAGQTIVFRPLLDKDGYLLWDCYGGTVPHEYRSPNCRLRTDGASPANNTRGQLPGKSGAGTKDIAEFVENAFAAGDYAGALEPATRLAEAGNPRMQYIVADIYKNGRGGIERDPGKALEWMLKAANGGEIGARVNVAFMVERGEGVDADPELAFNLFLDLAHIGNAQSQNHVGYYYATGKGTDKDLNEAFYWFERAASEGHAVAMRNLGLSYEQGLGTKRDPDKARTWYEKAVAHGDKPSKEHLARLTSGQ